MDSDTLWAEYAKTIVEIALPGAGGLRIHPAPRGTVGIWPAVFSAPIFVMTAWDPGADRLSVRANRERQATLEGELHQRSVELWSAVGWDPDSEHREEGVAVSGLSEEEATTIGARYGQHAIFRWTPAAWLILSCVDVRRHEAGWSIEPVAEEPSS
ncbi:MAG: DUF3293 domain-containing protein [Acidimicrobiales bacterium]